MSWIPTNRDEVELHLPLDEAEAVLRAMQKEEWGIVGALLAANTRKQLAQAIQDTRRWSEESEEGVPCKYCFPPALCPDHARQGLRELARYYKEAPDVGTQES